MPESKLAALSDGEKVLHAIECIAASVPIPPDIMQFCTEAGLADILGEQQEKQVADCAEVTRAHL